MCRESEKLRFSLSLSIKEVTMKKIKKSYFTIVYDKLARDTKKKTK